MSLSIPSLIRWQTRRLRPKCATHRLERRCLSSSTEADTGTRRRLDVAIVGAPNAGKSQLLNVLTQSPVAAVSRKRHTTRGGILGARTIGETQIIFKDTPGFLRVDVAKEERLDRDLIATAAAEMQYVDFTLLVVDAARKLTDSYKKALIALMVNAVNANGRLEEDSDFSSAKEPKMPPLDRPKLAVVLNKVDLVSPKSKLIDMAMEIGGLADECLKYQYRGQKTLEDVEKDLDVDTLLKIAPITFYISALEEQGTDDLLEYLVEMATPCSSWLLEGDQSTDMTDEERVQEILREKVYRCLHREVPHAVQPVTRLFQRVKGGLLLQYDLVVSTKSHHKLVLGAGGRTLERIRDTASRDLEKVFGCPVTLQLHVKLSRSKSRRSVAPDNHVGGIVEEEL